MQEPPPLPSQERSKPAPVLEESKQFTTPSALATFISKMQNDFKSSLNPLKWFEMGFK
jgi:hypothetical protein